MVFAVLWSALGHLRHSTAFGNTQEGKISLEASAICLGSRGAGVWVCVFSLLLCLSLRKLWVVKTLHPLMRISLHRERSKGTASWPSLPSVLHLDHNQTNHDVPVWEFFHTVPFLSMHSNPFCTSRLKSHASSPWSTLSWSFCVPESYWGGSPPFESS